MSELLCEQDEWRIEERDGLIDIIDGEGTIRVTMDWLVFQAIVSRLYHRMFIT